MPRDSHFSNAWLQTPEYKNWIIKKSTTIASCSFCKKDINVRNMGENA